MADRDLRGASVSVVIPTKNRPEMLKAAVASAFAQTMPPLEVIVVVDSGAEDQPQTRAALAAVQQRGLRMIFLAEPSGGAAARNRGVEAAAGDWIAFLDDDDLWLPDKLAVQLGATALYAGEREPVITCRVVARAPAWQEVWPRTPYRPGQPVSEYLFCRRGLRYGESLLQTSTLLAPRSLLLRIPFAEGLPRHQDWDWLLRAGADAAVVIECAGAEPLVVFNVEGERASVSRTRDWRFSLRWARERRSLFARRALRGFLATECAAQAHSAPWGERMYLLRAILGCTPGSGPGAAADLLRAAAFLMVGQRSRRGLREVLRAGARLRARILRPA